MRAKTNSSIGASAAPASSVEAANVEKIYAALRTKKACRSPKLDARETWRVSV